MRYEKIVISYFAVIILNCCYGFFIAACYWFVIMTVTIKGCPIPFHDGAELAEFLLHSGKLLYLFDGLPVYVDDVYRFRIRVAYWHHPFYEYIYTQR